MPPVRLELGSLSPDALLDEQLLADATDPRWHGLDADPGWLQHTPAHDPEGELDRVGAELACRDSRWGLDLDDIQSWQDIPRPNRQ